MRDVSLFKDNQLFGPLLGLQSPPYSNLIVHIPRETSNPLSPFLDKTMLHLRELRSAVTNRRQDLGPSHPQSNGRSPTQRLGVQEPEGITHVTGRRHGTSVSAHS